MVFLLRTRLQLGALLCCLLLGACATRPTADPLAAAIGASAWALASDAGQISRVSPGLRPGWVHLKLPGKQVNQFTPVVEDSRIAMWVQSDTSASLLRQQVHVAADELGSVKFSWKVPHLIAQADMALRNTDDSPVRIVLAFTSAELGGSVLRLATRSLLLRNSLPLPMGDRGGAATCSRLLSLRRLFSIFAKFPASRRACSWVYGAKIACSIRSMRA